MFIPTNHVRKMDPFVFMMIIRFCRFCYSFVPKTPSSNNLLSKTVQVDLLLSMFKSAILVHLLWFVSYLKHPLTQPHSSKYPLIIYILLINEQTEKYFLESGIGFKFFQVLLDLTSQACFSYIFIRSIKNKFVRTNYSYFCITMIC